MDSRGKGQGRKVQTYYSDVGSGSAVERDGTGGVKGVQESPLGAVAGGGAARSGTGTSGQHVVLPWDHSTSQAVKLCAPNGLQRSPCQKAAVAPLRSPLTTLHVHPSWPPSPRAVPGQHQYQGSPLPTPPLVAPSLPSKSSPTRPTCPPRPPGQHQDQESLLPAQGGSGQPLHRVRALHRDALVRALPGGCAAAVLWCTLVVLLVSSPCHTLQYLGRQARS